VGGERKRGGRGGRHLARNGSTHDGEWIQGRCRAASCSPEVKHPAPSLARLAEAFAEAALRVGRCFVGFTLIVGAVGALIFSVAPCVCGHDATSTRGPWSTPGAGPSPCPRNHLVLGLHILLPRGLRK